MQITATKTAHNALFFFLRRGVWEHLLLVLGQERASANNRVHCRPHLWNLHLHIGGRTCSMHRSSCAGPYDCTLSIPLIMSAP